MLEGKLSFDRASGILSQHDEVCYPVSNLRLKDDESISREKVVMPDAMLCEPHLTSGEFKE